MISAVLVISLAIQAIALIIILRAFAFLRRMDNYQSLAGNNLYGRFFIFKRRYELLKGSLLIIMALSLLQLISTTITFFGAISSPGVFQLLVSDLAFIVLVIVVSRIYRLQATPHRH